MLNPVTRRAFVPRLTVPEVFGTALSYQDQILMLAHWVSDAVDSIETVSAEELANLKASIETLRSLIGRNRAEMVEAIAKLQGEIDKISAGAQIYAVYNGTFEENETCMRDTVAFVSIEGLLISELNDLSMTCATLKDCGLNCHGLAVYGRALIDGIATVPPRFKTSE